MPYRLDGALLVVGEFSEYVDEHAARSSKRTAALELFKTMTDLSGKAPGFTVRLNEERPILTIEFTPGYGVRIVYDEETCRFRVVGGATKRQIEELTFDWMSKEWRGTEVDEGRCPVPGGPRALFKDAPTVLIEAAIKLLRPSR